MEELKALIKEKHFYYAKFVIDSVIEEGVYSEYKNLPSIQKKIFRLTKLPSEEPKPQNTYQLVITIQQLDILKEENFPNLQSVSQFFETKFQEEMSIFSRVMFHYPSNIFEANPPLPVVLEDKKNNCGKTILTGVRLSFPEHKEIDSVILDFQKCRYCKQEDIFVEVFSDSIQKYTSEYVKSVIRKSKDFSLAFVKERIKKDE